MTNALFSKGSAPAAIPKYCIFTQSFGITMLAPEHIHPSLWRATQLARSATRGVATGYAALSAQLPGGGWPAGALIELLLPHAGIGEIRLLQPALAQLDRDHPIALVQPPHMPHVACWQGWRLNPS